MSCIYFRLVLLLMPLYTFSQYTIQPVYSLWQPLYAYSDQHKNVYALQDNIASVVKMNSFECGIYGERRYLLEELSFYQAFAAVPTSYGNIALKTSMFSYPHFRNILVGVGYGKKLNRIIDCGLQFTYQSINIPSYTQRGTIGADIGVIFHLSDEINTGISIRNIDGRSKNNDDVGFPSVYSAGFGYDVSKQVYFGMEIKKAEGESVETSIALQYSLHKKLRLSIGMSPSSMRGSFAAGLSLKEIDLTVVSNYHQLLGISPAFYISYRNK